MTLTAPLETTTAAAPDRRDALTTGLLYLGVGLSGILGFLLVRPRLFEPDDPAETQANLLAHESLAQAVVGLELALVLTQALSAVWFYKLFRRTAPLPAGAIAVFGMANALVLTASAASLIAALDVAQDPVVDGGSQLLFVLSEGLWSAGSIFFGLWLVPMGLAVLASGWGPRLLGRLLAVGGVGYVLSAFAAAADLPETVGAVLVLPATAGELWMIGWLIYRGLR